MTAECQSESRASSPMSKANLFATFGRRIYFESVSSKGKRVSEIAEQFRVGDLDPHYTGYFELFNQGKFYEAHDVLEHIWLKDKHGANGAFYKGLIQLAGAFVHLQKNRLKPSAALFNLAKANLEKYPPAHELLDVAATLKLIGGWLAQLEGHNFEANPLTQASHPKIELSV
jgi:predicted metal-dependent hydrolase